MNIGGENLTFYIVGMAHDTITVQEFCVVVSSALATDYIRQGVMEASTKCACCLRFSNFVNHAISSDHLLCFCENSTSQKTSF